LVLPRDCSETEGCQQEQPRYETPQHVWGSKSQLLVADSLTGLPSPVSGLGSRRTSVDHGSEEPSEAQAVQKAARARLPSSPSNLPWHALWLVSNIPWQFPIGRSLLSRDIGALGNEIGPEAILNKRRAPVLVGQVRPVCRYLLT
jgi:hypothetical protein